MSNDDENQPYDDEPLPEKFMKKVMKKFDEEEKAKNDEQVRHAYAAPISAYTPPPVITIRTIENGFIMVYFDGKKSVESHFVNIEGGRLSLELALTACRNLYKEIDSSPPGIVPGF